MCHKRKARQSRRHTSLVSVRRNMNIYFQSISGFDLICIIFPLKNRCDEDCDSLANRATQSQRSRLLRCGKFECKNVNKPNSHVYIYMIVGRDVWSDGDGDWRYAQVPDRIVQVWRLLDAHGRRQRGCQQGKKKPNRGFVVFIHYRSMIVSVAHQSRRTVRISGKTSPVSLLRYAIKQ